MPQDRDHVPALPDDWTVADVQIFPSTFGPSVEMAIRTETSGRVSLFAVRPGIFDVVPATLAHQQDLTAAYWQIGDVAYALVGRGELPRTRQGGHPVGSLSLQIEPQEQRR